MIAGIGIDLVEVERLAQKIGRESGFRELVFSSEEILYCESKTNKYEHYAARFAAKEAFLKAMGTGWTNGTAFNEIAISNDETGKPELILSGGTEVFFKEQGFRNISVSLTHIKSMASAIVIIEN